VQRIRGIRSDQVRSFGRHMIAAIEKALKLSDTELPVWPSTKITPKREVVIGDMLYSVLKVITYEADIATELVATRDEIQALVRQAREQTLKTSHLAIMHGWRYAMAGARLSDLLSNTTLAARIQLDREPPIVLNFGSNGDDASQSLTMALPSQKKTDAEKTPQT
jgi:ribonuclease D